MSKLSSRLASCVNSMKLLPSQIKTGRDWREKKDVHQQEGTQMQDRITNYCVTSPKSLMTKPKAKKHIAGTQSEATLKTDGEFLKSCVVD